MDGGTTTKRQYSEYSETFSKTQREDDQDNQWDITSDGPDSTTSGSDIPEGHYDRPPEEEYSDVPTSGRPHVGYVAERLCSPIGQLEKAVVRLQRDMTDHCTELGLRMQTPDSGHTPYSGLRTPDPGGRKFGRPCDRYVIEGLCSLIGQLEKTVVRLQHDIADYRAELKISRTHTPAVSTRDWDNVQTTVEAPAPTPEVHAVEKLLQRLVTDTQSRPVPTDASKPRGTAPAPEIAPPTSAVFRKLSSGDGSNCACAAGRWTSAGFLAGGSRPGRGDPCRRRFRIGVSLC